MKKIDILIKEFGYREGFGVTGSSLETITKKVAELFDSKHIRINVPYYGFNCKGTANKIAREISGLTPFSKKRIDVENTTTLFYDDKQVNKHGYYLPFQGECNVYFVEKTRKNNNIIIIDLIKAPNWKSYL